jgi:hypothetical protein
MPVSETRVPQWCDVCRQADTDPRHHVLTADAKLISRHMDCCRAATCPDASCDAILTESKEKRSTELLAWIGKNR